MANNLDMNCCKIVLLTLVFCCAAVAELRNCSVICIYHHRESECPSVSPVQKETQLSSLENETKKNICVYLTSETHFLDRDFNYSKKVQHIEISSVHHSIISCRNQSSLHFYNKKLVSLSNLEIQNCGNMRIQPLGLDLPALHLHKSSFKLKNVTISNTRGIGLYAYNCDDQKILYCNFHNSTGGNMKIIFSHYHKEKRENVTIRIDKTEFSEGTSEKGGGIEAKIGDNINNYSMDIFNSNFVQNRANEGSHLFIHADVQGSKHIFPVIINVRNSNFSRAMGSDTSSGIVIQSGDSKNSFKVSIQNSSFTNSTRFSRALAVFQAEYTLIENCTFADNAGTGVYIQKQSTTNELPGVVTKIYDTEFHGNGRALHLNITVTARENKHST